MYPVICLVEKSSQNKLFVIPSEESLLKYCGKVSIHQDLDLGAEIFKSLMPSHIKEEITPSYLQSNNVSLHTVEVRNLNKAVKDFEQRTLLTPHDYDAYFVMNNAAIESIEARDWQAINEMVSINRNDTAPTKPKIH